MPFKDLDHIRELRRKEAYVFDDVDPATPAKRIILYSMDPWQLGVVEQFLHLALQRRGHRPKSLYYDGLLPITAWELQGIPPPPIDRLRQRAERIFEAFGIEPSGISSYLDGSTATAQARGFVGGLSDDELTSAVHRDVPVGRIALRDLFQFTLGHFEPRSAEDVELYRRHLIHAAMSVDLANAVIDADRPDIVILVNGKSVMYSYMYEVARQRGVQVTTWEEGMFCDTGIVLANNARAIDFPVPDADWAAHRDRPLTPDERSAVEGFFAKWRNQEAVCYRFYDREERDFDKMRDALDIDAGKRVVSIFTNIVWDTNALDRDRAFDGMMDWVFDTIDCVGDRAGDLLVIRAHPGESRWTYKTRTPVRQLVTERYGRRLPPNVRFVDGPSQFSSYEIAAASDRCAVYTSTLGIELSMMGLRPLICGDPFYAGKGITNDVPSKQDYRRLLGGELEPAAVDRESLLRFMHLVLFRLIKRPEFLVGIHGHPQRPKIRIETFEGFPETLPVWNEIVDCILENRSFVTDTERCVKHAVG